jgi:hypothetical protein
MEKSLDKSKKIEAPDPKEPHMSEDINNPLESFKMYKQFFLRFKLIIILFTILSIIGLGLYINNYLTTKADIERFDQQLLESIEDESVLGSQSTSKGKYITYFSCIDSDGGKIDTVKGTINVEYVYMGRYFNKFLYDDCEDSKTLNEYYCKRNDRPGLSVISCDYGCGEGICLGKGSDPEPPPETCVDNDGDGYGNPASSTCTFSSLDCNDNNRYINPGVEEVCGNGVDEDCSGSDLVCEDPEPPPETCVDNDGDGYGNPASSTCTFSSLDCNDNNRYINPGVEEVCGNGVDEDCSGSDLVCEDPNLPDYGEENSLLLWDGIASEEGLSPWKYLESCSREGEPTNCSGFDRLSVVSDPDYGKVYQAAMTLGDDYRGRARAEFSTSVHDNGSRVPYMRDGEEYYIGFRGKVNVGFDSKGDGDANSGNLMQLKGMMSCGGPAIGLTIKNGYLTLRRETQDGSSGIIWTGPRFSDIEGKWFELVIHIKYSTNSNIGYLEIWFNDVQQLSNSGGTKFYDQTICYTNDEVYLKMGIYRNEIYNKAGAFDYYWIHEPRVGYSYEAVAPR